ncbi:cytochrome b/b6 domain-containing protein [Streptomyces sp. N2-109]|uniref:Cytochrome b/b6 domain-containing protein n=1 Tax=Streptomyces gossypii TaxID=2883101 RepID=A0ABT2K3Z1_9ACTN|nr:cytochrome b/b6 domain-containing protein [Streptomyces gossypii]MCT2594334.1 cytochrome b/b6 domain-containing protein [Streptomyces gossypii]
MPDVDTGNIPAPAPAVEAPAQFTLFSRWLHWAMAIMIVAMLFIGAAMVASLADYHLLLAVHRPLGVGVLVLGVIRLVNRFTSRLPPHPKSMGSAERRAATLSEYALYALMLSQPLIGWGMVSASGTPLKLFGPVRLPAVLPHDPGLYAVLNDMHMVLGYALFLLFTVHMLAVLFHTLVLRDRLLDRMALWKVQRKKH